MKEKYKALFVTGPGLHCEIEREWFGDSLPILWWDQPAPPQGERQPFSWLVAAAEEKLCDIAADGPIDLIALSFGGQIARELARCRPELIRGIVLLGCAPMRDCFQRLVRVLIKRLGPLAELQNALAVAEKRFDEQSYLALFQAIAVVPDFFDHYWGPDSLPAQRKQLKEVLLGTRPIDIQAFIAITKDFLFGARRDASSAPAFAGKTLVVFGRHDPLTNIDEDTEMWKRIFPNAQIRVVNAGHFIHLERPASEWFPDQN